MSFKSLFIKSDEDDKPKKRESKVSFKNDETKFEKPFSFEDTVTPFKGFETPRVEPINVDCGPHMSSILQIYKDGLEGLNMPGYDFFEFYKAINQLGSDNRDVYTMAFTMAKAMDDKVTKDSLLAQSQYYITEITKVHKNYIDSGLSKKNEILKEKEGKEKQLVSNIRDIENEINRLNNELTDKKYSLSKIEEKYSPIVNEIDCKVMANDVAKDKTLESLEVVVKGIKNNLN